MSRDIKIPDNQFGKVKNPGPTNVAEAIRTVRPFGVDVCTGVRTDRALAERKLLQFMEAVKTAV